MKLTFSVAGIAGVLYGFGIGTIVAVAMPYLEATTSFSTAQLSALVASAMFASIFTTLTGGPMAEWWGRRRCIVWSSLAYAAGVPFICLSGGSFALIMAGLLVQGLAMGLQGIVVPLYLAETLPTEIRGRGAAVFQLFVIVGILVSGFIGLVATWVFGAADAAAVSAAAKTAAWRTIFSCVALPALVLFVVSFFLRESPQWRRGGEATKGIGRTEGTLDAVPLLSRRYVVPFLLVVVLLVFHQGLGSGSVLGYSVKLFQLSGLSGAFANGADMAFKFVMLVMTAIACVLVERKGRKFLLVSGVALCLAGLVGATAAFFCLDRAVVAPSPVVGAVVTVSISVYVAGFALGPGVCMWLILTEILPGRIRAVGMSVASVADITVASALQATFLPFAERFGYGPLFAILLASSVCYLVCVVLFLPETRGLSFAEIERFFDRGKGRALAIGAIVGFLCIGAANGAEDVYGLLLPRPVSVETSIGTAHPDALGKVTTIFGDVGAPAKALGEAYRLEIASDGVRIVSFGPAGERHARTTLAQLRALADGRPVPCGTVTDWPALRWRGLMLDCGRNWADLALVRDIVDHLARYKMNVFHWHLTDYYGWRLESKKYPQLQSNAAFVRQVGCYCTQEDFKAMVAYAAEKGVTIVPELDMPGHTEAFRRAFELEKMNSPGVDEILCNLIDELCSLVPADKMPFVHIGTDEVRLEREMVPDEWYDKWARRVTQNGRVVVGWWPGHKLDTKGVVYQETWYETRNPTGPYVDATCYYIDTFDPAGLLAQAAFKRPCPYPVDPAFRVGAEIQAWHDDAVAQPSDLVRDNPVFASIVLFSDSYWHDRAKNRTDLIFRPPSPGRPEFAEMADLERRALAQRDRVLKDLRHPLHLVGQTHMRWRLEDSAGRTIASEIPSGVVYVRSPRIEWGYPGYVESPTGTVTLVGRFASPTDRDAGAIVELSAFHRSGGRDCGTPRLGQWNRYGAEVVLNGERLEPPKWNVPGRKIEESERLPWTDESAWIRPFTPIRIRKGMNEVRLTLPKTDGEWYWSATFIPVEGTVGHPCEISDLVWE